MAVQLSNHQIEAIKKMRNGCILNGGVGSGKSRTALTYYYLENEGDLLLENPDENRYAISNEEECLIMSDPPEDLYIITTARKRDTHEWEGELSPFLLSTDPSVNLYSNKVVIDSWNNIKKYQDVKNAFFIFDEDRVTGNGVWVKSFLKIAKTNHWIILSATPGDTWTDYIPVFVANGFYKNRTEFIRDHVIYSRFAKFPKIDRYINTGRLIRLRNKILVDMDFERGTIQHHIDYWCKYDVSTYKEIGKSRWDPYKNKPIINAGELCYLWRKVVNSDVSRQLAVLNIVEEYPKVIIFYNFDYELDILKNLFHGMTTNMAEWNGHKHQEIPDTDTWIYLVQYTAGCEGWNCIKTNTIVFYSQNYSYKVMEQACGRIDRMNTPYKDLYYYHLKSHAPIDAAITRAVKAKKKFNERKFVDGK